jgi:S1-C subfamily serine protease
MVLLELLSVFPGGFAEEAGLEPGDILVELGGAQVYQHSDVWLVTRLHDAGDEIEVAYVRSGELRRACGHLSRFEQFGDLIQ